jgi:uncharacterized protein (TIGR00290 family)
VIPQVLLSWSGGKDAAWALHVLRRQGDVEVVGLLSVCTVGEGRAAMQGVRREALHAQAAACGLPLLEAETPPQPSNAVYTAAFADALTRARAHWPALRTVAFGDLFLHDIRAWREALCAELGWDARFPLFDAAPGHTATLAREMQAGGLSAVLVCVDTTQLDPAFCGRSFDPELLDALPPGCDPCGEQGEFHTLAWNGPMFARPLRLMQGGRFLREGRFAYADFGVMPESAS